MEFIDIATYLKELDSDLDIKAFLKSYRNNSELAIFLLNNIGPHYLSFFSKSVKNDERVALAYIEHNPVFIKDIGTKLRASKEFVLKLEKLYVSSLTQELKDDSDIADISCNYGFYINFQYLSYRLRTLHKYAFKFFDESTYIYSSECSNSINRLLSARSINNNPADIEFIKNSSILSYIKNDFIDIPTALLHDVDFLFFTFLHERCEYINTYAETQEQLNTDMYLCRYIFKYIDFLKSNNLEYIRKILKDEFISTLTSVEQIHSYVQASLSSSIEPAPLPDLNL